MISGRLYANALGAKWMIEINNYNVGQWSLSSRGFKQTQTQITIN